MGKESPTDSYRIGPESNRIGAETNRFKTYRILTCLNVRFFVLYHVRRIVMPIISSERWRFIFLLKRVSNWIVLVWAWIKSHQSWTESYLSVSNRYVANGIVFIVSYCLKDWDSPLVKKKKKRIQFPQNENLNKKQKEIFWPCKPRCTDTADLRYSCYPFLPWAWQLTSITSPASI